MNSRCHSRSAAAAFTLLEMLGVISIVVILAAIVGPNMMRKTLDTVSTREGRSLEVLATALRSHVQATQTIPGPATWATDLAAAAGLNVNQVNWADPANTATSGRVYLIHPGFTPSTGINPLFSQSPGGAAAPASCQIIILSSTKRGLALPVASGRAANVRAFDNIWNWTLNPFTKAPPRGWPRAWRGNGEHLHIHRVNLASEFARVTVSNSNFPTNVPFAKFNQAATFPFDAASASDAFYLRGTTIQLYRHDEPYVSVPASPDELNVTHVLKGDVNFVYDGAPARWRMP